MTDLEYQAHIAAIVIRAPLLTPSQRDSIALALRY